MAASYDGSIRIDTKINTTNAEKGVSRLSSAVKQLGKLILSVFAVKAIASFVSSSVEAYETQLTYETKLTTALQNRYNATSDLISQVKDLTAEYQSLGIIGDEVQMAGLSALSAYVDNVENLQTLLAGMNDIIAYNYGFDATAEGAESVATAIGRVLSTGSTRSLKALGVAIDEETEEALENAATEAEKVEILAEAIANSVGGINEELANTPTGQITQLKNEWGDFKELIGEAANNIGALFVPALRSALSVASSMADKLIELSEALQDVFGYTTSAVVSTATEAAEAEDDLADSAEAANEAIAGNYAGVDEITAMSADTSDDTDTDTESAVTEAEEVEAISDKVLATAQAIYDVLTPLFSLIGTLWADIKTGGTAVYNNVLVPIFELLTASLPEVTALLEKIYTGAIKPVVSAVTGSLLPAIKNIIALTKELINDAIMPLFNWLADKLTPVIQTVSNVFSVLSSTVLSGTIANLKIAVEFITGLVSALTAGTDAATTFANIGEVVKETVAKIAAYAKQSISKIAEVAESIITTVVTYISENLPTIIETAESIITTIVEAITEYLPQLKDTALKLINSLVKYISKYLPKIASAALNIIKTLIGYIVKYLPQFAETAATLVSTIVGYICEYLPELTTVAVELITQLIKFICAELPDLITAAISILQTLIDLIIENLSLLLNAAIEIIFALVDGIIENLPELITAVVQIITTIAEFIIENLPTIIDAGVQILVNLITGILQALPDLIAAIPQIILSIVTTLCSAENISNLYSTGASILTSIINGIVSLISQLPTIAKQIVSNIWNTLINTDWLSLGKNILSGIADGITNALSGLLDTIKNACSSIWNGIKNFFGIKSPSKLMRDTVGNYIAEGIGVGFEDEICDVADDMQDELSDVIDTDALADAVDTDSDIYSSTATAYETLFEILKAIFIDFTDFLTNTTATAVETLLNTVDGAEQGFERISELYSTLKGESFGVTVKELIAAVPTVTPIAATTGTGTSSETLPERLSDVIDILEDIADAVEEIKDENGAVTVQVVDSSGKVKSSTTTDASRKNRIAGKVVIPVGE